MQNDKQSGGRGNILGGALSFISEYASTLMGSGAYTSRVIRSVDRMAAALGVKIELSASMSTIMLSVEDPRTGEFMTKVVKTSKVPIAFELNSDLCRLSWQALDNKYSLDEIKSRYAEILAKPKMGAVFVLFAVGLANAAFCRLFGGDFTSMAIVFSSTLVGFSLKQRLQKGGLNEYLVFIASSFTASTCACSSLCFGGTGEIAIATSPLFLIPGVPLINGVMDILDGFTISGVSRLIKAVILIVCVAAGLSLTLLIVKGVLS